MKKVLVNSADRWRRVISLKGDGVEDEIVTDDDLLAALDELLRRHNLTIQDVDDIDFFRGPGSFIGLRMAAAMVNALNYALGRKKLEELDYPEYGREPNIG